MGFFVCSAIIITAFSFEGLLSLLSCGGTIFGTVAAFCKEDKLLRQLMLVSTSLWLTHNYIAGSPGAVVMEFLFISSNLVGYYRFYIKAEAQVLH